jgi:hypothetical protein
VTTTAYLSRSQQELSQSRHPSYSFTILVLSLKESYLRNLPYRWLWRACCGVDGLRSENGCGAVQRRQRPVHCPDDARWLIRFVRSRARAARAVPAGWSQGRRIHSDCVWLAAVRQTRSLRWFEAGGLTPARAGSSRAAWPLPRYAAHAVGTVALLALAGCRRCCAAQVAASSSSFAATNKQSALTTLRTTSTRTSYGAATTRRYASNKHQHHSPSGEAGRTSESLCREWSRASETRTPVPHNGVRVPLAVRRVGE